MYESYKKAFYTLLNVWQSAEAEVDRLRTENAQLRSKLHDATKDRQPTDDKAGTDK